MLSVDLAHDPFLFIIFSVAVLVWSLCLGSFTTAIIPREMAGMSWFSLRGKDSRSQCPHCHHQLSWRELIPVLSYVIQGRKCKHCAHPITYFYPVTELIICALTIILFIKNGFSIISLGMTLSLPFFAVCMWMSCHERIVNDRMLIVLAYIAVGTTLLDMPATNLFHAIYGAVLMGAVGAGAKLIAERFSSHPFLSWDAVKLWAVLGFWLLITGTGYFLFLMGVGGALWSLFPPQKLKNKLTSFPYVPWSLVVFLVLTLWL